MTITAQLGVFDHTRAWLVSSEAFVRDAMGVTTLGLDTSRAEAAARVHREEVDDTPAEENQNQTAPDAPEPILGRPRAIVVTKTHQHRLGGTGTWVGSGQVLVVVEALIPEAYRPNYATDSSEVVAGKLADGLAWGRQLADTIEQELMATSGRGDQDGTQYLNAIQLALYMAPQYPEEPEPRDYLVWAFEVEWF